MQADDIVAAAHPRSTRRDDTVPKVTNATQDVSRVSRSRRAADSTTRTTTHSFTAASTRHA
jgi:hypothetical protein